MGTLGTKKIQFYTMVQVFKFGTKLHLTIYTPANSGTNIEIEDSFNLFWLFWSILSGFRIKMQFQTFFKL